MSLLKLQIICNIVLLFNPNLFFTFAIFTNFFTLTNSLVNDAIFMKKIVVTKYYLKRMHLGKKQNYIIVSFVRFTASRAPCAEVNSCSARFHEKTTLIGT